MRIFQFNASFSGMYLHFVTRQDQDCEKLKNISHSSANTKQFPTTNTRHSADTNKQLHETL